MPPVVAFDTVTVIALVVLPVLLTFAVQLPLRMLMLPEEQSKFEFVKDSMRCDTVKLCWTWGAAFQLLLPAWLALIVHVPAPTKVTVEPDTVHTEAVPDVNATDRPELAVAVTV